MAGDENAAEPPRKKIKSVQTADVATSIDYRSGNPSSLTVPISPPRLRNTSPLTAAFEPTAAQNNSQARIPKPPLQPKVFPSPFRLTTVQDLPNSSNVDTISLKDLLGDPLISECWEFNYLHDVDFLMNAFDADVKGLVKVHVVHGFWKKEDAAALQSQASRYQNVTLHTAYMPEMFGTHHTKMMVLLRHDDMAQIIIHTANMIERDWRNMAQAVWRSPFLPLAAPVQKSLDHVVGNGHKFKVDFLNYLKAYDTKRTICKPLTDRLEKHDFSEIRGALVASVPGRYDMESLRGTSWGWPSLRKVLASVPLSGEEPSEIVVQVSSIATLGITDQWLEKTLFKSLRTSKASKDDKSACQIVFPTADEIRRSLDGYSSGASIRLKIESGPQVKQLQYLKLLLYHWAGDGPTHTDQPINLKDAGRKRAAPHIKTYIRFANSSKNEIDWALVTSANLSKQAWGEACNKAGDVRISSYELGVLVWPELYGKDTIMVPTFKKDLPEMAEAERRSKTLLGFRMPYDLPLTKYAASDVPWSATGSHSDPDWLGNTWNA